MSHVLVRRRVQVSSSCSSRHVVPVALAHLSHIRILVRSPRESVALIVIVIESEHGKPAANRKAASKHDQKDDKPRRDREAHVISLLKAHRALLLDVHRS